MRRAPYDTVTATFMPVLRHDLKPQAREAIGQTGTWTAAWIIEDGHYKGQWAFMPDELLWQRTRLAWVPEEDLQIAETAG
jgi:hypothetical protein